MLSIGFGAGADLMMRLRFLNTRKKVPSIPYVKRCAIKKIEAEPRQNFNTKSEPGAA
jgi:hypothetical protein